VAQDSRERNAEQGAGTRAGHTSEETLPPHAGINHDWHGSRREQGEDPGDQGQSWTHHHQHAVAAANSLPAKLGLPAGDLPLQLRKTQDEVIDAAVGGATTCHLQGRHLGLVGGHHAQVARDVGGFGRRHREYFAQHPHERGWRKPNAT
jgi:hypothetical protein